MLQIRWHGHSCFEITNDVTLMTDPHDGKSIGIPAPNVLADIILVSHNHYDHNSGIKTVEKEGSKVVTDERKKTIGSIEIKGISSFHDDSAGMKRGKNIIYKFTIDDITFCHLGDLGHILRDQEVGIIGSVDLLFLPVGGIYTIDGRKAWQVIHQLKPRIAVPMHFQTDALKFRLGRVEDFLGGHEHEGPLDSLDVSRDDLKVEGLRVVLLNYIKA